MKFTTQIPILKSENPIHYSSKIVLLGSCFAENISDKFTYFKFQNTVNPFGIIFNPVSIENLIFRVINNKKFTDDDVFFHNESWHCFEVHSSLSNPNKVDLLKNLNTILAFTKEQIGKASHLIITYGTSWIYRNMNTNIVVANCHKVSQKKFQKEILPVDIIEKSIINTIDLIGKINPNCNFIFTISPVRHIKDGFIENQQSKSHLNVALHTMLRSEIHKPNTYYFPSYEIMMDELRDYRFYKEDMLHPSAVAVDYIWDQFIKSSLDASCFSLLDEIDSIQKSLLHKPFNLESESYLKFKENLKIKIETIQNKFPEIQF